MATRMALKRLTLEYKSLQENPTPYIDARPTEEDILQWYYVITGPPDTPFEGGQFLGHLSFPSDYPYKPPSIRMLTPSGRFEPGSRLCLNMSDFHPESWNPAWNVSTILTGLLSFMCSREMATGAMISSPVVMKKYTKASVKWNLQNDIFNKYFSDVADQIKETIPDPDSVDSIEVVPPRASELIAHIKSSYRGSAYETAQHTAKSSMINEAKKEAAGNKKSVRDAEGTNTPASGGYQNVLLVIGAFSVLLVAVLMIGY